MDLGADGHTDGDGNLSHVHGRQQHRVSGEAAAHEEHHHGHRGQHTDLQVVDKVVQQPQVQVIQLAEPAAHLGTKGILLLLCLFQLVLPDLVLIQQQVAQQGHQGQSNRHGA